MREYLKCYDCGSFEEVDWDFDPTTSTGAHECGSHLWVTFSLTGVRLVVSGGREYADKAALWLMLSEFHAANKIEIVIHGCGRGADSLAQSWAQANEVRIAPFPAKWDDLSAPGAVIRTNKSGRKYNVRAGFDRNEEMAIMGSHLIAFWDGASRGTADMIKRANAHGLETKVVDYGNRSD